MARRVNKRGNERQAVRRRSGVVAVLAALAVLATGCFIPYDFVGGAGADLVYRDATSGDWFVVGDPTPLHDGDPAGVPVPGTYDNGATWEAAEVLDGVGWVTAGDAGVIDHDLVPPTLVDFGACAPVVVPVPDDHAGDAATEPAWYASGEWQIAGQAPFVPTNSPNRMGCAAEDDVPVPGDYDGDGKAEAATHRIGTGRFWIDGEAGPRELPVHLGWPTAGDFDGDGVDEPALLRPDGTLHTETTTYPAASPAAFTSSLVPVVADHDDDGDDDPAAFDMTTGQWWIEDAVVATLDPDQLPVAAPTWITSPANGLADRLTERLTCEHTPAPGCPTDATDGDLDGDGTAEITWVEYDTTTSTADWFRHGDPSPIASFPVDFPVDTTPAGGDFDGDGTWDPGAVVDPPWEGDPPPDIGTWHTSSVGDLELPPPTCASVPDPDYEGLDLVPLVGDWDGDGRDEPGWFCRSDATWHRPGHAPMVFGEPTERYFVYDTPVPGDYDGDGDDEPAVYRDRDGSWWAAGSPAPLATRMSYGLPVPADYDGDGDDDPQITLPERGQWQDATGPWVDGPGHARELSSPAVADYDGDGSADRAALRFDDASGELVLLLDAAPPVSLGTGHGAPAVLDPIGHTFLLETTFLTRACQEHERIRCPRPCLVRGDVDGDGIADPLWVWEHADGTATWHVGDDPTPLATAPAGTVPVTGDYDADGRWEPAWVDLATGTWTTTGRRGTILLPPPTCATNPDAPGALPVPMNSGLDLDDDPAWWCPTTGVWRMADGPDDTYGATYPTAPSWATAGSRPDEYHDVPVVLEGNYRGIPADWGYDGPATYSPDDGVHDGSETDRRMLAPLALPLGDGSDILGDPHDPFPTVWRISAAVLERFDGTSWQPPSFGDPDAVSWMPGQYDVDEDLLAEGAAITTWADGSRTLEIEGQPAIDLPGTGGIAYPATLPPASRLSYDRIAAFDADCADNGICPP